MRSLTAVFGMGTGVTFSLKLPGPNRFSKFWKTRKRFYKIDLFKVHSSITLSECHKSLEEDINNINHLLVPLG